MRYPGTAIDGPFEQHDLSAFCASENHAVKVGTYIISRRNHITHRLRIGVKPDAFNPTLAAGDLVRVRLDRTPSTGAASVHDYLYEVDRIGKSISGEVRLELTHFPVDSGFASVVAKEVDAAVGAGFVLPTGLSGITCDVNSSSDTTVPADTSLDPDDWDIPDDGSFDTDVDEVPPADFPGVVGGEGGGGGGTLDPGGDAAAGNPPDLLDNQLVDTLGPMQRCPIPGGPAAIPPDGLCAGAVVTRRLANIGDEGNAIVQTGGEELYSIPLTPPEPLGGDDWNGKSVTFSFECPDGTSQPADPCENPRPRDGTYDTGGRTVTITGTRSGSYTVTGCFAPFTSTTVPINVSSAVTYTSVASITVVGMDWTGGPGVQCGGPGTGENYSLNYFAVSVGGAVVLTLRTGVINLFQQGLEWSEVGNVSVTFADDPGNPVPIESLPRLS